MNVLRLSDLQLKYELGVETLQKECTDDHILKMADFFHNWELVAPYLGIKAEDVKMNTTKPSLQCRTCLQMWKEIFGYKATYYKLLEVLLDLKLGNAACKICALLQQGK